MRILTISAIFMGFSAFAGEQELRLEESNVSAADVPVCTKRIPVECHLNGRKLETHMGAPMKDENGNYIFSK